MAPKFTLNIVKLKKTRSHVSKGSRKLGLPYFRLRGASALEFPKRLGFCSVAELVGLSMKPADPQKLSIREELKINWYVLGIFTE